MTRQQKKMKTFGREDCFPAHCSRKGDGSDLEGEKTADCWDRRNICVQVCSHSNTGFKKGKQLK